LNNKKSMEGPGGPRLITPSVWGEPFWRSIHVVAMGLPDGANPDTKDAYERFFESLRTVIPCIVCARGYSDIADKTEPGIRKAIEAGPDKLFSWTVDVHNAVAAKLGQPAMSEDFVRDHYIFGDHPLPDDDGPGGPAGTGGTGGTDGTWTENVSRRGTYSALGEDVEKRAAPWDEATFARHSRNPALVYLAALSAVAFVGVVLWYAVRSGACSAAKTRRA
jgi:hypothetical protein